MTERLTSSFRRSARLTRTPCNRPFSIRLSNTERRQLEAEAGPQALGTYLRARLLKDAVQHKRRHPVRHNKALSEVLAKLGTLQLVAGLSGLAAAAKAGAVVLTPDLENEIRSACGDLHDMRSMLMQALGLQPEGRT